MVLGRIGVLAEGRGRWLLEEHMLQDIMRIV